MGIKAYNSMNPLQILLWAPDLYELKQIGQKRGAVGLAVGCPIHIFYNIIVVVF